MNVLLAAVSAASTISGIQRHAFNVARCLMLQPQISAVHLVVAPSQEQMADVVGLRRNTRLTIHVAEVGKDPFSRNTWYLQELTKLAASLQPDLIHFSYPVPVKAGLSWPTLVSLHDLYPYEIPGNFRFPHVLFNRIVLQQCLRNVDAIACVSDTTLLRLRQYTPERIWRKAVRVYNCVDSVSDCSREAQLSHLQDTPFLLCVAQHRLNKNIPLLIRVFQRLLQSGYIDAATKLVVVGIAGPETPRIRDLIGRLELKAKVNLVVGLSDAELQWCYRHCDALIVPSRTEGFGLPVAEGLLAGCRIVCSDIPALREVGGDRCTYVSLGRREEESLAQAIVASLQKSKQPPVPLPHFSAQVLGGEYVNLYRKVLSSVLSRSAELYGTVAISETVTRKRGCERGRL